MFEPTLIFNAQARYNELLREAEAERQVKHEHLLESLGRFLLVLHLMAK